MKPAAARLLVAIAAVVATLLALEASVRVVMSFDRNYLDEAFSRPPTSHATDLSLRDIIRPHDDDRVVYELRPGTRGLFGQREVAINSLGMRDVERSFDKAAGTFRIAGLGDSHMFGWGVDRDEGFLAILERRLGESFPGRRFEAWNLAVPGYNTVQQVESFLLRADRIRPDLVIINWVANDMDLPNFLAERPNLWSISRLYLYELAARRFHVLRGNAQLAGALLDAPIDARTRRYRAAESDIPDRYRPLFGWTNMVAALRHLADFAKERGIPVVLLFNWDDYRHRLRGQTTDVRPRAVRRLAKRCKRFGYRIVDPQDRIFQHLVANGLDSSAIWIRSDDSHTNPLRHRLVAEALLESLVGADLLAPEERVS